MNYSSNGGNTDTGSIESDSHDDEIDEYVSSNGGNTDTGIIESDSHDDEIDEYVRAMKAEFMKEACFDVTTQDIALVRRLLEEGASLTHAPEGTTALHWSLLLYWQVMPILPIQAEKSAEELEKILEETLATAERASHISRSEILNGLLRRSDGCPYTFNILGYAIGRNCLTSVKALVAVGANMEIIDNKGRSALHVAVDYPDILSFFLDNHDVSRRPDEEGYCPIHCAAMKPDAESFKLLVNKFGTQQLSMVLKDGSTIWHIIARGNCIETAQYLFQFEEFKNWHNDSCSPSPLNEANNAGETPVMASARRGYEALTWLFLRHGANLSCKGATQTSIELITKKFSEPTAFFNDLFDASVFEGDGPTIFVRYTVFSHRNQIKVVEQLLRCGQIELMKHPMIESLIYIKWKCLQPVFWFSIFLYMMFLIAFNMFVIRTFSEIDGSNMNNGSQRAAEEAPAPCGLFDWVLITLLYIFIAVLIIQEFMWMYQRRLLYFFKVDSSKWNEDLVRNMSKMQYLKGSMKKWLKWCLKLRKESCVRVCVLALGAAVPALVGCAGAEPEPWQRHVACAALLLAWLQAMLLLARCPGWGYYFHMFERVAFNIFKIFVTTIGIVFAFSACFMIEYQSAAPFDGPVAAFIKTLVMMSSEFDYEGLFDEEHAEIDNRKYFVYYLFLLFLFFIALALMNLMIGVAVSDVNKLKAVGQIRRLTRQVELLSAWQGLEKTFLGKWPMKFACIRHHKEITHTENPETERRKWTVGTFVVEGDYEEFLPKELHDAIYEIAKKKKQNCNKLDAISNEDMQQNEKDYPNSPAMTLKDMIKTIQLTNTEIKQCIDNLNKWNERIASIEDANNEIKQAMDDLRTWKQIIPSIEKEINDRMSSTEKGNNEIKQAMDDLRKLNERIPLIEKGNSEIKQSMGDFKKLNETISSIEKGNNEIKHTMGDFTNLNARITSIEKGNNETTQCMRDLKTLNERIPLIEKGNSEIKQSMDDFKKFNDGITLIEKGNNEINQSIGGLKTLTDRIDSIEMHNKKMDDKITSLENSNTEIKRCMNKILEIVTNIQIAKNEKEKDSS